MNIPGMMGRGGMMGGQPSGPAEDTPQVDTAENVQISSLALLKMLKHGASAVLSPPRTLEARPRLPERLPARPGTSPGFARRARGIIGARRDPPSPRSPGGRARVLNRPFGAAFFFPHANKPSDLRFRARRLALRRPRSASLLPLPLLVAGRAGVPMEVMGLMLGQFVDDYTVKVVDVFAMPQSGTGVSVEAVDPVFQTKMLEMLKQTGREEMVVGWYHSHPGFGCWLSGVDINTQQAFEALNPRLVSVVIDPVQSVKGKVVIDAFRLINPQTIMLGQEPRQTTSNLGHLNKPSIQALIHGLNRHYYSINISYRKNELEEKMLLNLNKNKWSEGLRLKNFGEHGDANEKVVLELKELADRYEKAVVEEDTLTAKELLVKNVGRQDAKKHLSENARKLMSDNIVQTLGSMLDTICF